MNEDMFQPNIELLEKMKKKIFIPQEEAFGSVDMLRSLVTLSRRIEEISET